MSFNRRSLMIELVYKRERTFYHVGMKLGELRALFSNYKKIKGIEISEKKNIIRYLPDLLTDILEKLSLFGFLLIIGFLCALSILAFNYIENVKFSYTMLYPSVLYVLPITLTVLFVLYRIILKNSIQNFFDCNVTHDDGDILISFMKEKLANDEKNNIIKKLNIEQTSLSQSTKPPTTKRRL